MRNVRGGGGNQFKCTLDPSLLITVENRTDLTASDRRGEGNGGPDREQRDRRRWADDLHHVEADIHTREY